MKRALTKVLAGSFVALLLAGSQARAAFIVWRYNFAPSTSAVFSDQGVDSGLNLSNEPEGTAAGNSDIVASNIDAFSDAGRDNPDFFDVKGDFSLNMKLTDDSSGQFAILSFGGKFNGPISSESTNVDLAFTSPETQVVILGDNEYTVTIGPYSPPGPPGSTNSGSIAAHVDVRLADDDPNVNEVPEPSTMLLSGIGMSFLGIGAWRKRRRQQKEEA